MSPRIEQELALLRRHWPDLDHVEAGDWVRVRSYPVPVGWSIDTVEICFRIPPEAATAPYGFYVRPALMLKNGDTLRTPMNYTNPVRGIPVEFAGGWAMFSWAPLTPWRPHEQVERGDNMTHFVRSFADRLELLE